MPFQYKFICFEFKIAIFFLKSICCSSLSSCLFILKVVSFPINFSSSLMQVEKRLRMWESMSLNGCSMKTGPVCMSYGTRTPKSYNSVSSGIPRLLSKNVSTCTRSSLASCQIKMSCSYKGVEHISFSYY